MTGILAKQAAGGIATQLISPEVNQWIKEATTNDKGETDKIANTLAHAIWGAIEATANRGNPTSGAIAAASAELAAPMLAKVLYNKDKAEYLTAEEKAQITALSSITAAVAGGLTAQGSSQNNTTVSSLTHASIGGEIGKVAVENNYLFRHEAEERARLIKELGECRAKGGDCTKIENRITELTQLDNSRNKKLNEACGYKMTPTCAKELVTLSAAHKSFKDYKPQNHYDSVVYSDFKEVEELYGEAQSRRMEHLAKQALLDISTHEPVENAVTLTRITIDALKGDETAKAQLRQIGNEIKKAALSPIDTISETTRVELKQADELEAAGYRDEADLIRMKVYLSNEIIAIGTFSSVSGLIHSGIRNVGKLAIKEGVLSNKEVKIVWGKGIEKQGKAWEEYLKKILPKGTIDLNDIKPKFKTFDSLLPDGTAISAKTMDTVGSKTYQNPKRITYQLNKYVDDMVNFEEDGKDTFALKSYQIKSKEMYLAIPHSTTKSQWEAINRSIDYAKSQGVKIIVKEVK
ncbi:DUF6862 domain-containing protein [Pasteurella multocida]